MTSSLPRATYVLAFLASPFLGAVHAPAQQVVATLPSSANAVNPLNVTFTPAGVSLVPGISMNPASTVYAFHLDPLPLPLVLPPFPVTCSGTNSTFHLPGATFLGPIVGPTPGTKLFIPVSVYGSLIGSGFQIWCQAVATDPSGFSPCACITDAVKIQL